MNKSVLCAAVLLMGLTACTSDNSGAAPPPEVFGPAGYRGLTPGMTKEAALATGKLAAAPTSNLDGCTDFSYAGGPAPDPARMAAEDAAEKKSRELNAKADEAKKTADQGGQRQPAQNAEQAAKNAEEAAKGAQRAAESAQLNADATMAMVELMEKREARDTAFSAEGGASFGKDGLRQLAAPPAAKTAEGISTGSTVDELKKAYEARGLKLGENERYQLAIADKPNWHYEFTVKDNKVTSVSIISSAECS
ncbi:hypothetical protein [Kibdelosporangium aridum]|uniref:Lipoprotein n=1 Tax=Kibdelosporangium aridum TaxID=2030 RepID=A0A1Y5XY42_KIBAR|nr:hypothetical protein [Kibdelosporangium aridum]SMD20750.1 hypothetical protein SAMN05661093_06572 [Kibdelosporangium aridum]